MDFKIPGLPHSIVKHAQSTSVRELRTTQIDMLFNKTYDRINHLIPSVQNQKQMIREVGNIELCELLETEPKAQCKVCLSYWDIGIVYCTCGHFLRKGRGENKQFVQYTMDLLSIPDYVKKKGRPHGHRYGKKPGDREHYIANQLKKKCKMRFFQGIHDRFIRDEQFRNRMIENDRDEDVCRRMDAHHLTPQEYTITKVIRGFVRTRQVPILCQCSADLTSNKHCLPCSN